MTGSKKDLVNYRLSRAKDTFEDALILAENGKWNSTINRLYYAAYYAVMALLISKNLNPTTHNGVKSNFSEHFIKTNLIPKELGKMYSQLFTWRQKSDYDDLFDFTKEKVQPYFDPVKRLIETIEKELS
ncbi:MAG TPA: HEPN domain-containing protein [Flammeovirgaceae bacterium]|nr:HEPN domain-containing protein [Flammeovirgaceae bacterium]